MEPLHTKLVDHVTAGSRGFADDSPMPALDPGRGRTHTGRLWVYTRNDRGRDDTASRDMVFHYAPDRPAARPADHLNIFSGILQIDG